MVEYDSWISLLLTGWAGGVRAELMETVTRGDLGNGDLEYHLMFTLSIVNQSSSLHIVPCFRCSIHWPPSGEWGAGFLTWYARRLRWTPTKGELTYLSCSLYGWISYCCVGKSIQEYKPKIKIRSFNSKWNTLMLTFRKNWNYIVENYIPRASLCKWNN